MELNLLHIDPWVPSLFYSLRPRDAYKAFKILVKVQVMAWCHHQWYLKKHISMRFLYFFIFVLQRQLGD